MSTVVAHPLVSLALAFAVGRGGTVVYAPVLAILALALALVAERRGAGRYLAAHVVILCAGLMWPRAERGVCELGERRVVADVLDVRLTGIAAKQSVDLAVDGRRVRAAVFPSPRLVPGERIEVVLELQPFTRRGNPSDFDPRAWAEANGYACRGRAVSAHGAVGLVPPFLRAWHLARQRAYDALQRLDEPARSVVRALSLGARSEMPPDLRERWSRAGVAHLLAISGFHVTLVAGAVFFVLRCAAWAGARFGWVLNRWPVWAGGLSVTAAVIYCAWVGAPMSARRATVMVAVLAVARLDGDRIAAIDALALVLLGLLTVDSRAATDIGLWLSVVAVAALVAPSRGWVEGLIAPAIATAPLVAMSFRSVAWLSPVANALAIPVAATMVTPLALAVSALPPLESLDAAATFSVWCFDRGARWFAGFDSSCGRVHFVWALVGTAAATGSAWIPRGWRYAVRAGVVLGLAIAALPTPAPDTLSVRYLAVGQGDSALIRFPAGEDWLVDGGGRVGPGRFDPGARYVVPALLDAGVRRLHAIVATHGDSDHIRGLHAVLERFPVERLYWNGRPSRGSEKLLAHARRRGVWVEAVVSRVRWVGTSRVVLRVQKNAANENDASVVTVVQHGGRRLVWPGDIGAAAEREHLRWVGRSDVLLAAHHGSASSSSAEWLRALSPRHVVVSVGRNNRYGMPHRSVLERLRARRSTLWRLDEVGQVLVETDGAFLRVAAFQGE